MTITLRPEHEELVAKAIETRGYESADDVIARALEVLRDEDAAFDAERAEINARIERAYAQFERGEYCSGDELKAWMAKRKEEWLRERKR